MGDFNLYRCTSAGSTNPPVSTADVVDGAWERFTPSMVTGAHGADNNVDPNGFLPNNPLFSSRSTVTLVPTATANGGHGYGWFRNGGPMYFAGFKMIFPYMNRTDIRGGAAAGKLFRGDGSFGHSTNFGPGMEVHVGGSQLSMLFEQINRANFRVFGNLNGANPSVPDPYNVTGAAGVYCPIPSLYISMSGLNQLGYWKGVSSIVQATQGAEVSMGREYWSKAATYTRNHTNELSRIQFGSGENFLTCCVEAISASQCQGNTSMAMSPTTVFSPGGFNLPGDTTGYVAGGASYIGPSVGTHTGLGWNTTLPVDAPFPNIAPIAARQFISVNIDLNSTSGVQSPAPAADEDGGRYIYYNNTWVGNIGNNIMSGDAFSSASSLAPFASVTASDGTPGSVGLGLYERYPDAMPAHFNPGKETYPYL